MLETKMIGYGFCCGTLKNGKFFTRPHYYTDGKKHAYNSDGLCEECFRISELMRAQRKINRLEEKLNLKKAELPKNINPESKIMNYLEGNSEHP